MAKLLDDAFFASLTFLLFFVTLSYTGRDVRAVALVSLLAAVSVLPLVGFFRRCRPGARLFRKKTFAASYVKGMLFDDSLRAHEKAFCALRQKYEIEKCGYESGRLLIACGRERERSMLCVLQKLRATSDDIVAIWRAYGKRSGIRAMVIAVPGKCEKDVILQALRLTEPEVILIDRFALRALSRKISTKEAPEAKKKPFHPLKALKSILRTRRASACLIPAILFLLYYLLTGAIAYLLFSSALCGLSVYMLLLKKEADRLL